MECNVTLTHEQYERAVIVGIRRRTESLHMGLVEPNYAGDERHDQECWKRTIEGAVAELAYCKFAGIEWNEGVNTFKGPDASGRIQVRYTPLQQGQVIWRINDHLTHVYVLVVGHPDPNNYLNYRVAGWTTGLRIVDHNDWHTHNKKVPPCYWLPQPLLRPFPFSDLVEAIA